MFAIKHLIYNLYLSNSKRWVILEKARLFRRLSDVKNSLNKRDNKVLYYDNEKKEYILTDKYLIEEIKLVNWGYSYAQKHNR